MLLVFGLLHLSLWMDGSTNIELSCVCIQTSYFLANCAAV